MVCDRLGGREPNEVELAMFSLLWSEHCSYKHSKKQLMTLPTEGPAVFMGPGENAGAVDVGNGWAVAFKVESHNHPSAVEPFQGAATGVGGILRDIFALGARPIAVLDSLRFGEPTSERSRYLLDHAVAGIAHYGNSIGVPTIGGELYFEEPYETNCLVNAMALGIAKQADMVRSAATGVGNILVLFGASTGRDGIGGASVLASAELDVDDEKRPTVQVGDPFAESKLLECSLELLASGLVVAMQDLGAAGLTSAASEMASGGEVGLELDVGKVPLREADMEPFEIMVSESQERMLCVATPENLDAVLALCEKWEVHGTAIGTIVEGGQFRIFDSRASSPSGELATDEGGEAALVGDMPVSALVDDAPLYDLRPEKPSEPIYPAPTATLTGGESVHDTLLALIGSPNIASRRPLFEQYDCLVQSRTVRRPEQADAAVLRLHDMGDDAPAIATSIDGNGRRVAADPYTGTIANALECAANLACVGAEPLGTTNNLNFGNPEKPHIAWQLTESVRGLGVACRALDAPIVGGNVSLYNEGAAGPIYPTPVVGMVGLVPDANVTVTSGFQREGDAVGFAGWNRMPSLAASELAKLRGEALPDGLPELDLDHCVKVLGAIRAAVRAGDLRSCHDVAEGGWLVANAEACLLGGVGADLSGAGGEQYMTDEILFGEDSCGFIISGDREALERLGEQIPVDIFGTVGGDALVVGNESWTLDELREAYSALAPLFP
jgi:phosphoribosylformylglycinamidine synthase